MNRAKLLYLRFKYHLLITTFVGNKRLGIPIFFKKIIIVFSLFSGFFGGAFTSMFFLFEPSILEVFWFSANIFNATFLIIIGLSINVKYYYSSHEDEYFRSLPMSDTLRYLSYSLKDTVFYLYVLIGALGFIMGTNIMIFVTDFDTLTTIYEKIQINLILIQFLLYTIILFVIIIATGVYLEKEKEYDIILRKISQYEIMLNGQDLPLGSVEKIFIGIGGIFIILGILPTDNVGLKIPDFILMSPIITPGGLILINYFPFQGILIYLLAISAIMILVFIISKTIQRGTIKKRKSKIISNFELNLSANTLNLKFYGLLIFALLLIFIIKDLFPIQYIVFILESIFIFSLFKSFSYWIESIYENSDVAMYIETLPVNWRNIFLKTTAKISSIYFLVFLGFILYLQFLEIYLGLDIIKFLVKMIVSFIISIYHSNHLRYKFHNTQRKNIIHRIIIQIVLMIIVII